MSANHHALAQGTQLQGPLNTYVIQEVLGQGTFGITYLATMQMQVTGNMGTFDTTVEVAIKEFFMKGVNGRKGTEVTASNQNGYFTDYKRKFLREAENLTKLEHPHIVKVLESFEANGTAYYVMEYLGGGSLADLIKQRHALSETDALKYTRQIASALECMHDHQMLHLDVKPSNVMLRETGEAVLIDFGLSKQFDGAGNPESDTSIGGGTPGYAPIEQVNFQRGEGLPVTMDIYALGATLFKMLTGQYPPEASTLLNKGFPIKALTNKKVSTTTINAIRKAMAPVTRQRCDSIGAFLNMLPKVEVVGVTPQPKTVKTKRAAHVRQIQNAKKDDPPKRWTEWIVGAMVVGALIFLLFPFIAKLGHSADTRTFTANGVSFKMVVVKNGSSSFMIGQTEVTQALWKAVMGNNPSRFQGSKRPVENVSWNDCKVFIQRLNSITHQNFRLPTEKEWEYAARGGAKSKGYQYSGGNNLKRVSWYWANSGDSSLSGDKDWKKIEANNCRTHNVKSKNSNELGIYDMSGNVWEWCDGVYEQGKRVMRGGSYCNSTRGCLTTSRDGDKASFSDSNLGLRLAL